jgi:hypothetical protein
MRETYRLIIPVSEGSAGESPNRSEAALPSFSTPAGRQPAPVVVLDEVASEPSAPVVDPVCSGESAVAEGSLVAGSDVALGSEVAVGSDVAA